MCGHGPGLGARLLPDEIQFFTVTLLLPTRAASKSLLPALPRVEVHFCIGHDCLKEGPEVEDLLMRLVARKAQAQGAQRLRARARFTEKGKLLVPCDPAGEGEGWDSSWPRWKTKVYEAI